jgi:hypothetical protein
MTDEELRAALADIERLLSESVEVWRTVLDADGRVVKRIYRGSFQRPTKETDHE